MENFHLLFSFQSKVARTDLFDLPRPRLHTDNCENHPPGEISHISRKSVMFLPERASRIRFRTT